MNILKLFFALIAIMILGFFAIGFADSVQPPTNATALAQYNNLSHATGLATTGVNATMLLLIAAMVIAGIFLLIKAVKK